jgi:hypothetical protein
MHVFLLARVIEFTQSAGSKYSNTLGDLRQMMFWGCGKWLVLNLKEEKSQSIVDWL